MVAEHMTFTVVTPISDPEEEKIRERMANEAKDPSITELPVEVSKARLVRVSMDTDELEAMLSMEAARYECPNDYLLKFGSGDMLNSYATESWRRRLCEWMFEVVDHFGFDREVVSISAYIMDRSASIAFEDNEAHATKRQYQLYAVASLYLALKIHGEMDPESKDERVKLRLSHFVELSRRFFTAETIAAKESEILTSLNWHVNPPTGAGFLSYYLELLPDWTVDEQAVSDDFLATRQVIWVKVFDVAKYLTELSVFISEFAFNYQASTVSYAALLCALEYVHERTPFPQEAHAQLLENLRQISPKFAPNMEQIWLLKVKLKELAPDFFPSPSNHPITRTVSLSDVESANHVAAAPQNKRVVSPISVSGAVSPSSSQEPSRKRRRTTCQPRS